MLYSPRITKGAGMSAQEMVEMLHSYIRGFQQQIKRMTDANREDFLHLLFSHYNRVKFETFPGNYRLRKDNGKVIIIIIRVMPTSTPMCICIWFVVAAYSCNRSAQESHRKGQA